jgi:pimeloyl-ACP methyl ester carboxylesterase
MPSIHSSPTLITPNGLNPHKPLFILLPSMEGSGQLLRTQAAGLETAFDVRCLVIPPDNVSRWSDLAKTVIELIHDALSKNEAAPTVYLGGESFGACLALEVAIHAPQLVSHLILINSASSFGKRPWMLWGGQIIRWFPSEVYRLSALGLLPFLAALERISPENRQALLKALRTVPKETSLWRLSLLQNFSLDGLPLDRLQQPVLIIASAADRLLPSVAEADKILQLLPNAKLHLLPDSGHACLLEEDVNLYQIMQTQGFVSALVIEQALSGDT